MENIQNIIDYYKNIYVTSDIHFYHKNILKYEPKRESLLSETKFRYMTKNISKKMWESLPDDIFIDITDSKLLKLDVQARMQNTQMFNELYSEIEPQFYEDKIIEHNKTLIDNYNSVVKEDDLCIIAGDFSLAHAQQTNELLKQLNGSKLLLRGNHDNFIDESTFDKNLVLGIYDYLEFKYNDYLVVMMHYPILHFKRQDYKDSVHLFGHIHSTKIHTPFHSYHVGVDTNKYKPLRLNEAIKLALEEESGELRYYEEDM